MSLSQTITNLPTYAAMLWEKAAAGDPQSIAVITLGLATLLTLLIAVTALLKARKAPPPIPLALSPERLASLGGRIERLEKSQNQARTEIVRDVEQLRSTVDLIQRELRVIKKGLIAEGRLNEIELAAGARGAATVPTLEEITPEAEMLAPEEVSTADTEPARPLAAEPAAALESVSAKLQKTRRGLFDKIKHLFSTKPQLDQDALAELEATLISSDLGPHMVARLLDRVKTSFESGEVVGEARLKELLKQHIGAVLKQGATIPLAQSIATTAEKPFVILMVGVNGVGKTTTCAKLAWQLKSSGKRVLLAACDTFRAAAVEQLNEWGKRLEVPVVAGQPEAKPATVVFDAMTRAKNEGFDVVIIDTAGRLHNRANLMQELEGVKNSLSKFQASAPQETLLVIDGVTGQNALVQAEEFNQITPLSGIVVTKLDGTPKGGIVVAIQEKLNIPVRYIGLGEAAQDLRPFNVEEFVAALFDEKGIEPVHSEHGETRRRRRQ